MEKTDPITNAIIIFLILFCVSIYVDFFIMVAGSIFDAVMGLIR